MHHWFGTVKELIGCVHDHALLEQLHFSLQQLGAQPDRAAMGAWAQEQFERLSTLASYSLELACSHAWNHAIYSTCLPFLFSCLHHESHQQRSEGLARVREIWESVLLAEGWQADATLPAAVKKALNAVMSDLIWNEGQIAREIYSSCEQRGWQATDEELREFSYLVFATPANTKFFLEDCFSHLADVCNRFARHTKLTKQRVQINVTPFCFISLS